MTRQILKFVSFTLWHILFFRIFIIHLFKDCDSLSARLYSKKIRETKQMKAFECFTTLRRLALQRDRCCPRIDTIKCSFLYLYIYRFTFIGNCQREQDFYFMETNYPKRIYFRPVSASNLTSHTSKMVLMIILWR